MEVSKSYQDNNLFDICSDVPVDLTELSPEKLQQLQDEGWDILDEYEPDYEIGTEDSDYLGSYEEHYDVNDIYDRLIDDIITLPVVDVYDLGIYEAAEWENTYFDELMFVDQLSQFIDVHAYKYLSLGSNMGWRRLSGYGEFDNIEDAIYRNYDCSIYLQTSEFDRKILTYTETSHDAVAGFTIIALTEEEYDALTNDGYDDPNDDMVNKILTQGHLDPEDFDKDDENIEESTNISNKKSIKAATDTNTSLYQRLLDAGYPEKDMYHHYSTLYVYVTPLTTKVINDWCADNGWRTDHPFITKFRDQIEGKLMYDLPFCYPDWSFN